MKNSKFKSLIVVILFVIIIAVPSIIYWINGKTFVKTVAKEKQKLSELYEGKFRSNVLPILSDILTPEWYKEALQEEKKAKERAKKEKEQKAAEEEVVIDPILQGVPTIPEGLPYLAPTVKGDVIIGRNGWLYINQVQSVDFYLGNCILSDAEMERWRYSYERLKNLFEERGVKLAIVIGPDKEQVYPEFMPSYKINSVYKRQLLFEKYMHENSNVDFYYPIRELAAPKGMYNTYYQCDTHWNEAGGLLVTSLIYDAFGMGINKKDIRGYTEPTTKGDIGWVTGNTTEYTDYRVEYKKDVTVETKVWNDSYDIDNYGKTITSSNKNGNRLFIIGDSFRVAPMNIMEKDFETTEVIHRNLLLNYDYTSLAKVADIKEGDCVAIINVERFDYLVKDVADIIYNQLAY